MESPYVCKQWPSGDFCRVFIAPVEEYNHRCVTQSHFAVLVFSSDKGPLRERRNEREKRKQPFSISTTFNGFLEYSYSETVLTLGKFRVPIYKYSSGSPSLHLPVFLLISWFSFTLLAVKGNLHLLTPSLRLMTVLLVLLAGLLNLLIATPVDGFLYGLDSYVCRAERKASNGLSLNILWRQDGWIISSTEFNGYGNK